MIGYIVGWEETYREDGAVIQRWGTIVDEGPDWVTVSNRHDHGVSGIDNTAINTKIKPFIGVL